MDTITASIIVFGLGILELWIAVPAGLFLKLNPIIIFTASAIGGIMATLIVSTVGENIRNWFLKWRYGENREVKSGRIYDIWNKYGIIGLGLLSPLLFGAPLGAALGIALGASKERLVFWMSVGIVMWSAGLTLAGLWGLVSFEEFINKN